MVKPEAMICIPNNNFGTYDLRAPPKMSTPAPTRRSGVDSAYKVTQPRVAEFFNTVARISIPFRAARLRVGLLVGLVAGLVAGCSVADSVNGVPGVDTSTIAPGVMRTEVESRLGAPVRSWVSEHGVRYSLYQFSIGVPPNGAATAAMVIMDVATAGIWEIFWAANEDLRQADRKSGRVVVSFDDKDVVLGLFDEFDMLPTDGRSDQRPKVFWD